MSAAEACSSLLEAIDAKRTDIIKSILDHISASSNKGDNTATLREAAKKCFNCHIKKGGGGATKQKKHFFSISKSFKY